MKDGGSNGRAVPGAHGAQTKRQIVKLTRPPPRRERRPEGAQPSPQVGRPAALYVRIALALLLIVALVFAANQAMLYLTR